MREGGRERERERQGGSEGDGVRCLANKFHRLLNRFCARLLIYR